MPYPLLALLLLWLLTQGKEPPDDEPPPEEPVLELGPPLFGHIDANGQSILTLAYELFPVGGGKDWSVLEGPAGTEVGIDDTGAKSVRFTFTLAGNYLIKLMYTVPGTNQVLTDTVLCQVDAFVPPAPTLDLGEDKQVQIDSTGKAVLILNYAASGPITSKDWDVVSGPAGSQVGIDDTGAAQARLEFTVAGDYMVKLTVTVSNASGSVSDDINIQVLPANVPPPPPDTTLPDPPANAVFITGNQPNGFTVPAGQHYVIQGHVTTPKSVIVYGKLWGREKYGSDLHFMNVDNTKFQGGVFNPETDIGLWVEGAGELDYRGNYKEAWGFGLKTHPSWKMGDETVEAPMFYSEIGANGFKPYLQGSPLRLMPNGVPLPVLNLTRGVKLRGEPGKFAHYRNVSTKGSFLADVEISWFGVPGKLGRYPVHHHMREDASRGHVIRRTVVKHSGQHAFVAHMSSGITFEDCIAYDTPDEQYWYDRKTETSDLTYLRCISAWERGSDYIESGFLLARVGDVPQNGRILGCWGIGIGGRGTSAAFHWSEGDSGDNRATGGAGPSFWDFEDNGALACRMFGWSVWQNSGKAPHQIASAGKFTSINCGGNGGGGGLGVESGGGSLGAYSNIYVIKDNDIYNSGPSVGVQIWANGTGPHERINVRGGTHGIRFMHHSLPREGLPRPCIIRNCDFQGQSSYKIGVGETKSAGSTSQPGVWWIIDCGVTPADVEPGGAAPDTIIQIQQGNLAWRRVGNGNFAPIPLFA